MLVVKIRHLGTPQNRNVVCEDHCLNLGNTIDDSCQQTTRGPNDTAFFERIIAAFSSFQESLPENPI